MSSDSLQYRFLISPDVAVGSTSNTSYASASLPLATTLSSLQQVTILHIKKTAVVEPKENAGLGGRILSVLLHVSFAFCTAAAEATRQRPRQRGAEMQPELPACCQQQVVTCRQSVPSPELHLPASATAVLDCKAWVLTA